MKKKIKQIDWKTRSKNAPIERKWFNIQDVIKYTGLSYSTIHRAISNNSLMCSRITGKNLMLVEWVDNWIMGE